MTAPARRARFVAVGLAAPAYVLGAESSDPNDPSPVEPGREHTGAFERDGEEPSDQALSVLLVDDDPSMRLVCVVNLEAEGFRVAVARTGQEALDLAAADPPDIVLLDVMLPDLGGFEVAEQLREVPIVFLSARTSEVDLKRGQRVGAIDYITKPFDPIALPTRLREDLDTFQRSGSAAEVWQMRFGPPSQRTD
jgi:CheY-like chemotaxis protein